MLKDRASPQEPGFLSSPVTAQPTALSRREVDTELHLLRLAHLLLDPVPGVEWGAEDAPADGGFEQFRPSLKCTGCARQFSI